MVFEDSRVCGPIVPPIRAKTIDVLLVGEDDGMVMTKEVAMTSSIIGHSKAQRWRFYMLPALVGRVLLPIPTILARDRKDHCSPAIPYTYLPVEGIPVAKSAAQSL